MLAGSACAALLALSGPLAAAAGEDAVAEARAALEREDGVAAEMAGRRAMREGAPRAAVAGLIGEGELLQGDLADARDWLGPAEFDQASRQQGLRALARLELQEGNLEAAAAALSQAMQAGETAPLWVDVGRLRYRMGNHVGAQEASARALVLEPGNPRALEFAGQLARDAQGVRAALPFFARAVQAAPQDVELALQYAATLGEAGDYAAMLTVIRALEDEGGQQPQAFYLQAVLAARAGKDEVARRIWWQTGGAFSGTAAGLLVDGIIEYRAGNAAVAVDRLSQLSRMQPGNYLARVLLARALVANGEANVAIALLLPLAGRPDASPYVLVLAGRAYEQMGQRDKAAPYLDRAAAMASVAPGYSPALVLLDDGGRMAQPDDLAQHLRNLFRQGSVAEAVSTASGVLGEVPGSVDLQFIAGDTAWLAGDSTAALQLFGQSGAVRSTWPLAQRRALILAGQGNGLAARRLLSAHLASNPQDQPVALLLGRSLLAAGQQQRAAMVLRHAASLGAGPHDPLLLADLAELEQAMGHPQAAQERAGAAHALARGNRRTAQVLARIMQMQGDLPTAGAALLAKANQLAR